MYIAKNVIILICCFVFAKNIVSGTVAALSILKHFHAQARLTISICLHGFVKELCSQGMEHFKSISDNL